jgi:diguanylate cyclase (GGDEF)-like protein
MGGRDPGDNRLGNKIERRRAASRSGLYRPALVALSVGLLLSLAGAYAVGRWECGVAKVEFERVAETQVIVMQHGVNEYLSRLVALRTLFESANEEITRSEFETFSGRLFEQDSGIRRIAWLPRVNRKERAEYEAAAVSDGISGYRFKSLDPADGSSSTAAQSDEYFPVFFSTEPKTSMSYGLDYGTDPDRRATLDHARDDDIVAVLRTRLYEVKGGGRPTAEVVCVPVFAKGTSRDTIADRRRNLAGFVVGIFDLTLLLQSIRARTAANPAVGINVYPPEADNRAENQPAPDFSSERDPALQAAKTGPIWSGTLRIGDSSWPVRVFPTAGGALIAHHDRAVAIFASGLVITIVLAVYLGLASRNSLQLSLANRRVLELAQTDILTGLPNRAYFLERLQDITSESRRGGAFSILMLDLDRFKNVNDSLGHAAGDALLRQVAERLRSTLRSTDVLARFGGDEFAIVQTECEDQRAGSIDLARRIAKLIAEPFQLPGHRVEIGTSIGIAIAPEHGNDQEQLLKKADLALYRSKSAGRNCHTLYDDAMLAELEARKTLEGDLRDAIARCQFEVHYQPFYEVQNGLLRGLEALVRWRHPVRGLIPPDQFIPLAEETGLIVPLGEWVVRQACDDATSWPGNVKVAVNLSPVQFKQAELFDVIQSALQKSGLAPERLEIEITESVLLERAAENHSFIEKLKRTGISLALDDFGTGYSSLSYLTMFPFDKIKIDKSFIRDLTERPEFSAIISSVVTLARGLKMSVTAEGVETREQLETLRSLGVNFAQGYLLGRPMPVSELEGRPQVNAHCLDALPRRRPSLSRTP